MATQTLTAPLSGLAAETETHHTAASRTAKPLFARLMNFIVATQTHRAQRAIALHMRSRGLEFRPLDAEQPPH